MKGFLLFQRPDGRDIWIRHDVIQVVQAPREQDDTFAGERYGCRIETTIESHRLSQSVEQVLLMITASQAPDNEEGP